MKITDVIILFFIVIGGLIASKASPKNSGDSEGSTSPQKTHKKEDL